MFTDMVGYTALTQSNEPLAMKVLERHNQLLRPMFSKHHGKEIKSLGDSFLVEFDSALDALNCALEIQSFLHDYNISSDHGWRISLRIGIHLGDVVHQGVDVFGDAVNIASRMESAAEPDGICVSDQVYGQVRNKIAQPLVKLDGKKLKNVQFPIDLYRVVMPWTEASSSSSPNKLDMRRIAVLPFASLSPDPNDEYFADGMTEEIISTLSKIGRLKVIARTSVMRYKGGVKTVDQIGQELMAGTVLEGSVRKAGDRVRITVQLIDSQTNDHLWSESYDRKLNDVFAIQSDISRTVADSLKVKLLSQEQQSIEQRKTGNPQAYVLYLKGRSFFSKRTRENIKEAIKYFEQATALDPNFALAYSGLSDCYNVLSWEPNFSWMAPNLAGPSAKGFSEKALEIDDNSVEAHASSAVTLMNHSWDFESAESEFKRALSMSSNYAPAQHWYGNLLIYLRRFEEALTQETRALDLDPFSRPVQSNIAIIKACMGRNTEAIESFTKVVELNPDFGAARMWKSQVHAWMRDHEAAIEEAKRALTVDGTPTMKLNLAWVYSSAGKENEARKILEDVVEKMGSEHACRTWIGLVALALGQTDDGYRWLEEGLAEGGPSLFYFAVAPWTKEYRADPRWMQIERRLGLS